MSQNAGSGDGAVPRIENREEALVKANQMLLTRSELGADWAPGKQSESDYFAGTICGVSNEPKPPAAVAAAFWDLGSDGTSVFQTVRPVGDEQARQVVQQMREALKSCREYDGSSVTAIPMQSPAAIGLKMSAPEGDDQWVYVAHAGFLSAIYARGPSAGPELLNRLVAAQLTY